MYRDAVTNRQKIIAVAPMIDWTDRHCRFLHRLLNPHVLLYTEMVVADAVLHGDIQRLLGFSPQEHPVALQLGGADPDKLASAAEIGARTGYDEINLNVGCPSDRVQSGTFGACLMRTPETVAAAVRAMKDRVDLPVTVKCRIGVDDQVPETVLPAFVDTLAGCGVDAIWVHARKAWLAGLSPKQNREIPPLDYPLVHAVKNDHPGLFIGINGGITSLGQIADQLGHMDGVMIGRAAYRTPMLLAELGAVSPAHTGVTDLDAVVAEFTTYAAGQVVNGARLHHVVKPLLGLLAGQPGARLWRRRLSDQSLAHDAPAQLIADCYAEWQEFCAARYSREAS